MMTQIHQNSGWEQVPGIPATARDGHGVRRAHAIRLGLPCLLFVASLAINLWLIDPAKTPARFGDSASYESFARLLLSGRLPPDAARTPVYPAIIALFQSLGDVGWVVYAQIAGGALSIVLLYAVALRLVRNELVAAALALLLALDYFVVNFQAAILSESLSLAILMLSLWLHLIFSERSLRWPLAAAMVFNDLLLIFLRPNFLLLPICLYLIHLAMSFARPGDQRVAKDLLHRRVALGAGILLIAASVVMWSAVNARRGGYAGFSSISEINLVGKWMQYQYMRQDYLDPPPLLVQMRRAYHGAGPRRNDPYVILENLKKEQGVVPHPNELNRVNKYVMRHHRLDFVSQSIPLVLENFTVKPEIYVHSRPGASPFVVWTQGRLFWPLNSYAWWGWLIAAGYTLWLLRCRRWNLGFPWLLIVTVIAYQLATISVFAAVEYSRLRMPVHLLLLLLPAVCGVAIAKHLLTGMTVAWRESTTVKAVVRGVIESMRTPEPL